MRIKVTLRGYGAILEVGDVIDLEQGMSNKRYTVEKLEEDGWAVLKQESFWEKIQRKFSKK